MQAIKRHISRQESATWAVVLTFAVVLLYSVWGASILEIQRQAAVQDPASAVAAL